MRDSLLPDAVEPLLRGRFGRPYVHHGSCASTQQLARGLPEGAVVACDEQTAGRGRLGRRWESPPGGLFLSLVLRPRTALERLAPLSLVLAEAVCDAVPVAAAVRWPNDVVAGGRKLAGILPELREREVVAGIGINANIAPAALPEGGRLPPTSLVALLGAPVDRAALLADVLAAVERRYDAFERGGFAGLERDELRGREVQLADGTRGTAEGVDHAGRLLVAGRALASGEVEWVRVPADGTRGG